MDNTTKFANPYLAGIGLGLVLLASFLIMGKGLGASGAASRLGVSAVDTLAPVGVVPAAIGDFLTRQAKECAAKAHRALCCRGYSRTDMIYAGERIFVLETNTIPGMTPVSLFPLSARTAGLTFSQLLDRLIDLGLENRK